MAPPLPIWLRSPDQALGYGTKSSGHPRGSGLGLSLVKSFVELHGGRVEIASEPDAGTRITCHLPVSAHGAREAAQRDT